MNKEVKGYVSDWCEYRQYEHRSELDVLALTALKNRLFQVIGDRAPGGILTHAYEWDFVPVEYQRNAIDHLVGRIGFSWGYDRESAIKQEAFRALTSASPFIKEAAENSYRKYRKSYPGSFYVHGVNIW